MTKTAAAEAPAAPVQDVADAATSNLPATIPDGHVPATLQENEWAGVSDGDLAPAGETLLPLLPMNRNLGEGVLDPSTGEKTDTLEFIWLSRSVSRAWWPVKFDERDPADPAPKCRSIDGLKGIGAFGPGSDANPSGKCATCPRNTWTPDKDTPACNASIEAMIAMPDMGADGELMGANLYRLRFGGIAYAKARTFWDSFKARVPAMPPTAFLSQMVLEPVETKNGRKLAPTFSRLRQFRLAEVQAIITRRDELIGEFKRLIAEEVETGAVVDVVDDQRGDDAGGPFDGPGGDVPHSHRPFTEEDETPKPTVQEAEAVAKVEGIFAADAGDPGPTPPNPHEGEDF